MAPDEMVVSPRRRKALNAAVIACGIATLIGLVTLWPSERGPTSDEFGDLRSARVTALTTARCSEFDEGGTGPACVFATVVVSGSTQPVRVEVPPDRNLRIGSKIVVSYYDNADAIAAGVQYQFHDVDRGSTLLVLAIVFALAVVLLGRLRGLAALAGLVVTLALLLRFILPAILAGRSPMLVAVVGAAAIAFVALYAAHGIGPKTTVALLGTLASLGLAALVGAAFTAVGNITGQATEEATILAVVGPDVDFIGILLAGLIIGALGAIDDVTVTQTSTVWELHAANPQMGRAELLRAAMRVGRDHVGSTVNTLVLAYAGSSTASLLLFSLSGTSLLHVANGEIIAVEIIRTLAGSIALIASVPITTYLAVHAVAGRTSPS